jgi:hypothetical protein
MAGNTRVNKVHPAQRRKAENRQKTLQEAGVPQDHAKKLAKEDVTRSKQPSGRGGGSAAGGEAKKKRGTGPGRQRTGTDSNASK